MATPAAARRQRRVRVVVTGCSRGSSADGSRVCPRGARSMRTTATVAVVTGQLRVVEAWVDVVDPADAGAATALVGPDPEVGGPQGRVRCRRGVGPRGAW